MEKKIDLHFLLTKELRLYSLGNIEYEVLVFDTVKR